MDLYHRKNVSSGKCDLHLNIFVREKILMSGKFVTLPDLILLAVGVDRYNFFRANV